MRGEPSSSRSLVTAAPAKRPDDQAVSVVQHLEPALAPFVLQRARQCRAAMLQQHHAALSLSASTAYILAACGARGLAAGPSIEVLANPTNRKARTTIGFGLHDQALYILDKATHVYVYNESRAQTCTCTFYVY